MRAFNLLCSVGLFLSLLGFSCCDDPEPDPCKGLEPLKGGFTIGERITNFGGIDTLLVSDTVLVDNLVVFEADTNYASYEWKVGDDPRTFDTKSFTLHFTSAYDRIPVRLIAKWNKNTKCFPDDDGVDTVIHYLTVIPQELNPIIGQYIGSVTSAPTEVFKVTVSLDDDITYAEISNINNGCELAEESSAPVTRMGFKAISISDDPSRGYFEGGCKDPRGWLFLKGKKTMEAVFTTGEQGSFTTKRVKQKFIGTKID